MAARKAPVVFVAALAAGALASGWGQSARAFAGLPEEAPESLVALELGDASVSLEIEGFWEASVTGALTAAWSGTDGLVVSAPVPLFVQTPDLWLSLVIAERWFLEARADPAGTVDEFAGGWRGGRDDFLDEIRVGNTDIGIPAMPGLPMGPGSPGLFGVALRASDGDAAAGLPDTVRVFAAARYEQAALRSRIWRGDRPESVATVPATAYIRDSFFVLPEYGVANLALYLESAAGSMAGSDGRLYRRLGADEYALDATDGLVDLRAAAKGRLLAAWTGGVVDGAVDPFAVTVTVDGRTAGILFDPEGLGLPGADPHAYQSLGRYLVPDDFLADSSDADLVDATSGLADLAFALAASADGSVVELAPEGAYGPRSEERRRPLGAAGPLAPDGLDRIYLRDSDDPDLVDAPAAPTRALRFRTLGAPGAYAIGAAFVPGSVEVRRNGVRETLWTLDGNLLVLASPAAASEEIEIRWLETSADRHDGTVAAAVGAEFPGTDARSWIGFGTRWGIPGTGYSEAGGASLATIDLAAGVEGRREFGAGQARVEYSADARTGWRSDDSTGRRLVSGMDEDAEWNLPYRLAEPDPSGATALERREDAALAEAFPDSAGRYVSGVANNTLAFVLDAPTGGLAAAERVVEAVPLGEYRSFAFWYRADTTTVTGTPVLRVRLVSGAADALAVVVPLPGTGESAPWTRIEVALDSGPVPTVLSATGDRIDPAPVAGASAALDRSLRPGLVRLEVEGVESGTVELDALSLEKPVSGFLALGRGGASWTAPGGLEAAPFLTDPSLTVESSGEAYWSVDGFETALTGNIEGAIGLGPVSASAGARAYLGGGGTAPRLALRHGLALPEAGPFTFAERFSSDPVAGRLSREDSFAFGIGDAFGFSVEAGAGVSPAAFSQDWSASLRIGPFSADGTARLESASVPFGADAPYPEAWFESWTLLLPAGEAEASIRTVGAGLKLEPAGRELAALESRVVARPDSLRVERTFAAGLRRRFDLGEGASLEPAYARKSSSTGNAPGASFRDDLAELGATFAASPWLLDAVPVFELFDSELAGRFAAGTAGDAGSAWSAEASLDFARRYGSNPIDLLLPSEARVALRRELARRGDTVSDVLVLEAGTGGAALDLFGSSGSKPLSSAFEYDEYALRSSYALRLPSDDSGFSAEASASALAIFSDSRGQEWRLEERAVFDLARDGTTWSNTLDWTAALRPGRTWLSDLLSWTLDRALPVAPVTKDGEEDGGTEGEAVDTSVVSAYLVLVAEAPRVPLSSLALGLELSSPERSGEQFVARLRESWMERVTAHERLVLETRLTLAQGISVEDGRIAPFAELSASLSLKVIF
ncbi:MAG: hypothetical protein JXA15_14710 [Spirochaetales bacterium]|nr:hypothetical protein [Spirochaetales bacterium]